MEDGSVKRAKPAAARLCAATGGCVMCERLAGVRGLPAPVLAGRPQQRHRHREAFSAGYERDTNGIRPTADGLRTGYEKDTNHDGTAQRWDRLSAATADAVSECRPGPVVHRASGQACRVVAAISASLPALTRQPIRPQTRIAIFQADHKTHHY